MTVVESVKKVRITGGDEVLGKKRRGGRKTQTRKLVADAKPSQATIQLVKGGSLAPAPLQDGRPAVTQSAPAQDGRPAPAAQPVQDGRPAQQGGTLKHVKLAPKKPKVILEKSQTRKAVMAPPSHTRKIRLAIHGIHKNIHKAKTIKNKASQIPIEDIKKELKSHGLWKPESKAPEAILRGIYADFQTLREKAL